MANNVSNLMDSFNNFDFDVYKHDMLHLEYFIYELRNCIYLLKKVAVDIDSDLTEDDLSCFRLVFSDIISDLSNKSNDIYCLYLALFENRIFNAD